jgi:hypothetical protein
MTCRWTKVAAAVLVAASASGPVRVVNAAADDQARLDEAIDAFGERMVAAGWESQGPPDSDDDEAEDEDVSAGDDAFLACFEEVAVVLEDFDADEFPGQLAASESDEFVFAAADDAASTTDELLAFDETEETALALAVSVDDANVATVTRYIDVLGSAETADCIREAVELEMPTGTDVDIDIEFEVSVENEADLGIGDHSAALRYHVSTMFVVPITADIEIVFAQTGNDFAAVAHIVAGEPQSDFDTRSELQTIVDDLSG